MPDTDRITDIRSNEWNIKFFQKIEGKNQDLYLDQFRSLPNPISRDQIFHFQWKKNWDLYLDFWKFVNFVKNFLHVILFLGLGDIPEEIWSISTISKGCPPLTPPLPAPHPLLKLQKWATTVGAPPDYVKNNRDLPRRFQRSKKKCSLSILHFFLCKRCRWHDVVYV
jgi:hypothetical protein